MNLSKIEEVQIKISELARTLKQLSDADIGKLFSAETITAFLQAIWDPTRVTDSKTYADFFITNKNRATVISLIRYIITHGYSFVPPRDTQKVYVSPFHQQWFNNGVLFLEGDKPFSGWLGLYQDGKLKFGLTARDMRPGEEVGPDDFNFISIEEFNERLQEFRVKHATNLDIPILELSNLLDNRETQEGKYQEFFEKYPWVLNLQYKLIQSHRKLDDRYIPDFTGVRISDGYRDIIEIKQPFLEIFKKDGNLNATFNDSWNKIEEYLNFAREDKDYMKRKGLNFDNPKCYLIVGFNLPAEDMKKIRTKERLNPAITVLTYDSITAIAKSIASFAKSIEKQ